MIGRRTGLIIANTVLAAGLGFLALKMFAVAAGTEAEGILGQLAFALGLAGLLSFVLDLGFGPAHVKRISEGGDLARAAGSYAAVKLALALGFLAVVAVGAVVGARLGILTDTTPWAIVLVALFYALLNLRGVFTATFDGREEFVKSQATVLVENLARAALVAAFAFAFAGAAFGQGPFASLQGAPSGLAELLRTRPAEVYAACYAVAALASLLVAVALFRRGYALGAPDRGLLRDYWRFGRHIFLAAAVGTVYLSLDKVVITAFWEPANTGRYYGAQRFSDLIGMVPLAVYTVLFPALSARYARGDKAEVRAAMEAALRHMSLIVVPLVAFTIALAAPLLSLVLTGEFAAAVPVVRILALFALVYALLYPYVTLLQALGRPDLSARAAVVSTALNAGLNLLLVPRSLGGVPLAGLAETGSAIATVIAATVQLTLLRREVHRLEGRVKMFRHTGRHVVAGALLAGVVWALAPLLFTAAGAVGGPGACTPEVCALGAPAWTLLLLLGTGALVYLGALAALREFTRHDLALYLHILDPAAMARYISEEVQRPGPGQGAPPNDAGRAKEPPPKAPPLGP